MKIAIVQPYFFPYIGYWQLIRAADRFIIYDDVNYIKGGWINRNRILINGKSTFITLPLYHSSPNKKIHDIALHSSPVLQDKLVKMIQITYRKAPFYAEVFPIIEELIRQQISNLSEYLANQLKTLGVFMGIKTEFILTSRCYGNSHLSGEKRVIDICKREHATTYINSKGGRDLYNTESFRRNGIKLRFLVMRPLPYKQKTECFIPYLSIIDALMEIGVRNMTKYFDAYDLIT